MMESINKLSQQPPSLWVSIAALLLSITSLVYSVRTTRFSRRLSASEKRTDALQTLAEARFTVSQIFLHLWSRRQATNMRPDALSFLDESIRRAEDLVKQLDAQFDALLMEPVDALSIEQQRRGAKVTFASVKKVADSLELVDRFIGPSGGSVTGREHG